MPSRILCSHAKMFSFSVECLLTCGFRNWAELIASAAVHLWKDIYRARVSGKAERQNLGRFVMLIFDLSPFVKTFSCPEWNCVDIDVSHARSAKTTEKSDHLETSCEDLLQKSPVLFLVTPCCPIGNRALTTCGIQHNKSVKQTWSYFNISQLCAPYYHSG